MVKQLLGNGNFEVRIARDGNEAGVMFREYEPDMVLLDIDMPGRNGWELIREFKKEREWIPEIHISDLRKYLSGDSSVRICNKRWGGYSLITPKSI